jgi:DHA2 family methylenomycin A resistance protein-like MFS transporter
LPNGTLPTGWSGRSAVSLAAACFSTFVVYLNVGLIPVAVPAIRSDFHAGGTAASWLLNSYTLTFAVFLLTAGAIGDRFGQKMVLLTGTAGFAVCSAAAACAPGVALLVAARAGQGLFAAAVVPSSFALIGRLFADPRVRLRAVGIWSASAGAAVALGPLAGGLLVEAAGWRGAFWVNLPAGVAALVALLGAAPRSTPARAARLDVVGQLLFLLGVGALTFVLVEGGREGWTAPSAVSVLAGGVASLALFARWEARCPEPMLPPRLLRIPVVAVACTANFLGLFGVYAVIFLLALHLEGAAHLGAAATGLRLLAYTAVLGVATVCAPTAARWWGTRRAIVVGLLLVTIGLVGLAALAGDTGYLSYAWALGLLGVGVPLSSGVVVVQAVMSAVPPDLVGTASGAMNTSRQLGACFGVALAGGLGHADPATSMHVTFLVAAAGALAGAVLTVVILRDEPLRQAPGSPAASRSAPPRRRRTTQPAAQTARPIPSGNGSI